MRSIILVAILSIAVSLSLLSSESQKEARFHTDVELRYYKNFGAGNDSALLGGRNELFTAVGECSGCHGHDQNGVASVTAAGEDINVVDDWRATMMAMSAKDPFWRAKVSHESLVTPGQLEDIESSCTDCHAPLGFFNAMHIGQPHYTMADLKLDSVALDGVSCAACHQISADGVGSTFSGQDIVYVEDTIYGQYENPFAGPMQSFVGFVPEYSAHISESEVCASCHTLITETIGINGQLNGEEFVEQATYHEWLNSAYNTTDESAVECQGCHMTEVNEDIVIAANLLFLPPRSPFFRHDIVGGNTFMLNLMKENRDTLKLTAYASHFDTIIDRTTRMLQENTLDVSLSEVERTLNDLTVDLELTNKAGHKFPSAYPSRIAFVRLVATDEMGDTLFASGLLDENFELLERDLPFEPHYDFISSEEEVQVYELVFGDELGQETTTLTKAQVGLKDNRLVPFGFSTSHSAYDTTKLYGQVLLDDDFNLDGTATEGTGRDNITYQIPLAGYQGDVTVEAEVFYQVTPPRWLEEMFAYNSDDIDHFRDMYDASDKEPVRVGADDIFSGALSIKEQELLDLVVYPNPSRTGEIAIDNRQNKSIDGIAIHDAAGRLVKTLENIRGNTIFIDLPRESGIYYLTIKTQGQEQVEQVLRL